MFQERQLGDTQSKCRSRGVELSDVFFVSCDAVLRLTFSQVLSATLAAFSLIAEASLMSRE